MSEEIPTDQEINSFLETEFFFYLLPCYYGFASLIWRYFSILDKDVLYYVRRVSGEWLLRYIESEEERARASDTLPFKVLPASYVIKSKLSLLNSYLYLLMIGLSFISTGSIFYSANHRFQSLLYLFGFMAWYFAAVILRRELQRGIAQSLWVHRFFWVFAGTFSITKMFEDYFLPLNLILNCLFLTSNIVLAIYGIYRPEDTDSLALTYNEEIPSFVKIFFQTLELNSTVRYLLSIEDEMNENIEELREGDQLDNEDLKDIDKSLQYTTANIKEEINLLATLPRRNFFVDRKMRYLKLNERFKLSFFILTQIGNSRFESQHFFDEFIAQDTALFEVFQPKNFPKFQLPRLTEKISQQNSKQRGEEGAEYAGRAEAIEDWLQQIGKFPIFMSEGLLKFLNVDGERSAPFVTYYSFSYKLFCSKGFLVLQHKKKIESQKTLEKRNSDRKSIIGYYTTETGINDERDKFLGLIKAKLLFTVTADAEGSVGHSLALSVICRAETKNVFKWSVLKSEESFAVLNSRIEEECDLMVAFYYKGVAGTAHQSQLARLEAYRQYLQAVLNDRKYYCEGLFEFVRFNPVRLEVVQSGQAVEILQQTRRSQFNQDYEDKGNALEITRVEKIDDDVFKLTVRRTLQNDKKIVVRTTGELIQLRERMACIYRGVSVLPELELQRCHKAEIKCRAERFLSVVEGLPKIQINKDYLKFYEE